MNIDLSIAEMAVPSVVAFIQFLLAFALIHSANGSVDILPAPSERYFGDVVGSLFAIGGVALIYGYSARYVFNAGTLLVVLPGGYVYGRHDLTTLQYGLYARQGCKGGGLWVGEGLERAELPLFDKDDFLEHLFSESLPAAPLDRRQLSQRADRAFQSAVESSQGGIVVSWWKHPRSDRDSGTPTGWLLNLPGRLVEVYCMCTSEVAVARFLSRRRHPGHLDELWSNQELSALLDQSASLGPLHIGGVVEVDCSESVDYGIVWTRVMDICQGT